MSQHNFQKHDRSVDDDPEVDRTERKKIGGNLRQIHHRESEKKREGNGESDDEGASDVSEEKYEDQDNQRDALKQGASDPLQGCVDQFGPV